MYSFVFFAVTAVCLFGSFAAGLPCYDATQSADEKVEIEVIRKVGYLGVPVTLFRDSTGKPEDVKWAKIDGDLPSDAKTTDKQLVITATKMSDAGYYTCQPYLTGADVQKVVQLVVKEQKPTRNKLPGMRG